MFFWDRLSYFQVKISLYRNLRWNWKGRSYSEFHPNCLCPMYKCPNRYHYWQMFYNVGISNMGSILSAISDWYDTILSCIRYPKWDMIFVIKSVTANMENPWIWQRQRKKLKAAATKKIKWYACLMMVTLALPSWDKSADEVEQTVTEYLVICRYYRPI